MKEHKYYNKLIVSTALFIGLPILLYALGDFPRKSILKEFFSLLTVLAFCFMLAQFYFTRHNKYFSKGREFAFVVKIHRYIGYIFILVLVLHPFFIVLPRFFEAGVDPWGAFVTLFTEFGSLGVVLGLIAYGFMILLFLTTFFRNKFHLQYRFGRMFHGYLSILFVIVGAWHFINIGSHANTPFIIYIILMLLSGVIHLLRSYFIETQNVSSHE